MKFASIIACGCAALLSAAAFATEGADNVMVSFSTNGSETYADGAPVNDGEFYALVWVAAGEAFQGFSVQGELVSKQEDLINKNNLLLGLYSNVKGKTVTLQMPQSVAKQYLAAGDFELYLLDTRSADKKSVAPTKEAIAETGVQSFVKVASLKATSEEGESAGTIKLASAEEGAVAQATIPSGILPPVIKNAEVKDGMFVVTVEQTSPCIRYNLAGGETPAANDKAGIAEAPKAGDATKTIELKYPIKDGESVKFFKVTRDPISK